MPGPTISEVHINRIMTNLMTVYEQSLTDFVCDRIFAPVPVLKKSDLYFKIPKDAWFKGGAVERAPGTESAGINYHVTTDDYLCKVYAVHFDLDDQTRANYDTPLAADTSAMRFVARNLLLTREMQWLQRFFQPDLWSGFVPSPGVNAVDFDPQSAGTGCWDTSASDPVRDIRMLQTRMQSQTGYRANKLVMAPNVFDKICDHPVILDRIKYTQRGIITEELLATLFQVDEILVLRAVLNTAQTGRVANMGFMASNSILLCHAPKAASIQEPSAGYTFQWTGYEGAGDVGNRMTTIRMPHLRSDRMEGEMAYDMKVVAPDLGIFGVNMLQNP